MWIPTTSRSSRFISTERRPCAYLTPRFTRWQNAKLIINQKNVWQREVTSAKNHPICCLNPTESWRGTLEDVFRRQLVISDGFRTFHSYGIEVSNWSSRFSAEAEKICTVLCFCVRSARLPFAGGVVAQFFLNRKKIHTNLTSLVHHIRKSSEWYCSELNPRFSTSLRGFRLTLARNSQTNG